MQFDLFLTAQHHAAKGLMRKRASSSDQYMAGARAMVGIIITGPLSVHALHETL